MEMTEQTKTIVKKYHELCSYCDTFFNKATTTAGSHIECRRGCGECCVLQTVCEIEAHAIYRYSATGGHDAEDRPGKPPNEKKITRDSGSCPFLEHNNCTIYPIRPIICRTHGLPLLHRSESRIECCPRNFEGADLAESFSDILFDAEAVTEALMRLNAAFLISRGENPRTINRVDLHSLKRSIR